MLQNFPLFFDSLVKRRPSVELRNVSSIGSASLTVISGMVFAVEDLEAFVRCSLYLIGGRLRCKSNNSVVFIDGSLLAVGDLVLNGGMSCEEPDC